MRWFWFRFSIQNIKPYTIIWSITSTLLLTQYAENTYPLTFPSNKSALLLLLLLTLLKGIHHVPSISTSHKDVLFWHLYISQSYTPGMPKYLIILSWTLAILFSLKSSLAFWGKMAVHKFIIIGYTLSRIQCQLHGRCSESSF